MSWIASVAGNYCVGYDPARVTDWDSQVPRYRPRLLAQPKHFLYVCLHARTGLPENTLGFNDSIGGGTCATKNFYFVTKQNYFGRDEVQDNLTIRWRFTFPRRFYAQCGGSSMPTFSGSFNSSNIPPGPELQLPGSHGHLRPRRPKHRYEPPCRSGFALATGSISPAHRSPFPPPSRPPADNRTLTISALPSASWDNPTCLPRKPSSTCWAATIRTSPTSGRLPVPSPTSARTCASSPALRHQQRPGQRQQSPGSQHQRADPCRQHIRRLQLYPESDHLAQQQYGYLNPNYTPPDTNTSDPLDTLLPDQGGALYGDSSATPFTGTNNNYNFAIARVRLKGSSGVVAQRRMSRFSSGC